RARRVQVSETGLIGEYFRVQAALCGRLGSEFYAALLPHLANDAAADGPVAAVFADYPHEVVASAAGLRLLGAVHRLVLLGQLPALARHYPSVGGDGDAHAAWRVLRNVIAERDDELPRCVPDPPLPTNQLGP